MLLCAGLMAACGGQSMRPVTVTLGVEPETRPLVSSLANAYQNEAPASRITLGDEFDSAVTLQTDSESDAGFSVPIGLEVLVVVVHSSNPMQDISMNELSALLRGEVPTWETLGGNTAAVNSIQLPEETATRAALRARLPNYDGVASTARLAGSAEQAVTLVAADEGAFTVLPFSSYPPSEGIKIVKVGGYSALEDRQYPLLFPIIFTAPAEPTGDTLTFLEWVLSDAGQEVVAGYALPIR